jgi:hypothetical protein
MEVWGTYGWLRMYVRKQSKLRETIENRKRVTASTLKPRTQSDSMWKGLRKTTVLMIEREDGRTAISKENNTILCGVGRGIMH